MIIPIDIRTPEDIYNFLDDITKKLNQTANTESKRPHTDYKNPEFTEEQRKTIQTARIMMEYNVPTELICQSLGVSKDFLVAAGLIKPEIKTYRMPVEIITKTKTFEDIEATSPEEAMTILQEKISIFNKTHETEGKQMYCKPTATFTCVNENK